MLYQDAEEGAKLLGLTLTARNNGGAAHVPMAGVPVRARDDYLERLVRLGRRVAICEQMEDPSEAKGIVRRAVVETVTPGAVLADTLLSARRNNFLVAVAQAFGAQLALAAVDVSTGEVVCAATSEATLEEDLARLEPAELLLPLSWETRVLPVPPGASRTFRPDWLFDYERAGDEVRRRYRLHAIEGFGFQDGDIAGVCALGALLAYIGEVQPSAMESLRTPRIERGGEGMSLDEMTRRNLELVEPLRVDTRGARTGTLIEIVDETLTAMGARMLRRWVLRPLIEPAPIWARQDAVAELLDDPAMRRAVRGHLKEVRDLERLAGKTASGRALPRELKALADSLGRLPALRSAIASASSPFLAQLRETMDVLDDVHALVTRALSDEPPALLSDGGAIRTGYSVELDDLRTTLHGARDFIAALQTRERARSGIASLKVGYNQVFGYYIEVTRTHAEKVPPDYERKQTLANAERYVTPELKEWEATVLGAEERILSLETQLFADLRRDVAAQSARVQEAAGRVATLDVLTGLAQLAERRSYVRPEVHTGYGLEIRGGRHAVVETMMPREEFIPNDVLLGEDARIMILTGPNMAGKSTLLRQVGLIQLMAQIGSFVPATRARLPLCDRIFTRVGASDNLVRGQSTFMVEMNETAAILHGATSRSLVLLDEIGRGTATYDGVSIAWAVTEHLHERTCAKTIFATHYHELTQLADVLPALVNFNVAVKEVGNDIVFLHHLQVGGADRSYGIDVARLAGVPASVIERAREILRQLESAHAAGSGGRIGQATGDKAQAREQLSLFAPAESQVLERLRRLDVTQITPLQALNVLAELLLLAEQERRQA
jgi:DNA mismatch repair protein MutS